MERIERIERIERMVVVRDGAWMELGSRLCVGLTLARYIP